MLLFYFFFSSRRRHTRFDCDWSSDVCSSDLATVDQHTSVVLSWAHPEFRASAMATDGSVVGIAAPHGAEGPGVWLLELQGVLYRQRVPVGTVIVTSGLGGIFPRGIPIGVVIDTAGEEKGWGRTYLVRPAGHTAGLAT